MVTGALLLLLFAGPPEPVDAAESEAEASAAHDEVQAEPSPARPRRRVHRCLAGAEPCYRTTSARLILASGGVVAAGTALALVFVAGDRNQVGDPAVAFAGAGVIALSGAALGGLAALLHGDGATLDDRITPATFALSLAPGGSSVIDEEVPHGLTGSIAPTWTFPRDLGRLRLLGRVGGDLGQKIERDPRPQLELPDNGAGGTFPLALESSQLWVEAGLDLALRLPYPMSCRSPWLGQFELRLRPLFFVTREKLRLSDGESRRISQRVALTPLNFGFRWHVSPRQRFTFYLGPRWDLNGYGEPGAVETGGPTLAPIYSETWFDLDIPLQPVRPTRRVSAVAQLNLGYVHSRLAAEGINWGASVGFLGYTVAQLAVRVRPRGAPVAYQVELGARMGNGLNPYLRVGIVLPNLESKS